MDAGHQAGLRAGAAGGMHQMRFAQTHGLALALQLEHAVHVAQRAQRIGPAAGNDVGLAPLFAQLQRQCVQRGIHRGAGRHPVQRDAEQMVQQHVARLVVLGRRIGNPFFQDGLAGPAHERGRRSGLPHVVGLHGTLGEQRVGAQTLGFADQEFELACLAAAGRQPGAVVTLDVQAVGAAEPARQALHRLQRRGPVSEADAWKVLQVHRNPAWQRGRADETTSTLRAAWRRGPLTFQRALCAALIDRLLHPARVGLRPAAARTATAPAGAR